MNQDDPWLAFGDDSDNNDGENEKGERVVSSSSLIDNQTFVADVALFLAQHYLKLKAKLTNIRIHIQVQTSNDPNTVRAWEESLSSKGFVVTNSCQGQTKITGLVDAVVIVSMDHDILLAKPAIDNLQELVVSGGIIVIPKALIVSDDWDANIWRTHPMDKICQDSHTGTEMVALYKWTCPIQSHPSNCPWLSRKPPQLVRERERLEEACVCSTALERETLLLSTASIEKAVRHLNQYGYCVIPHLLDPETCHHWGKTILSDLQQAASVLLEREDVDLFRPLQSASEPATYRELSMREDLRLDLRHGPSLDQIRGGPQGGRSQIVRAPEKTTVVSSSSFLRGHESLLEIVRRVMNPKDDDSLLYRGNFGRYNFSGSGPDGSFQDLRVGPVGGIVSLPGSGDQAVHADTPHLFEHVDALPAHYINAMTPGCPAHGQVGQTAFVAESHRLAFCAQHFFSDPHLSNHQAGPAEKDWKSFVVRPFLDLGDVVLFDCRLLHFGMANTSTHIQRPLLYTNMTQHWFHDPKNWDDQRRIFDSTT